MIHRKHIYTLLLTFLFFACGTEDIVEQPTGKRRVEITTAAIQKPQSRTNFKGDAFTNGDKFTLYEGNPQTATQSSTYTYTSSTWSGTPGLYWDDLGVWNNDGTINNTAKQLTAVLTNRVTWIPTNSFPIETAPATEAAFLKSDLLVAYDSQVPFTPLDLKFYHVMARLRIEIEDLTTDGSLVILGDNTTLSLNALTGNSISFDPTTETTTVTAGGGNANVTLLRTDNNSSRTFTYEIILPPQALRTSTLTISGNANKKEYPYDLSTANVTSGGTGTGTTADLLQQGYTTTISLKIAKTGLELGNVLLTKWVEKTSQGIATPEDYPIIEIGGGGSSDDNNPDPTDDFAGKTIRLTEDITLEDLAKKITIPLGSKDTPFRGTFDGQGYTITDVNLTSQAGQDFLGIFGYTDGATIKDLNVTGTGVANTSTNSSTATGGLAGYANNTRITNCHVDYSAGTGVSAAYDNAGGLVGFTYGNTTIDGCSASTAVKAGHDYAGGLVGRAQKGTHLKYGFSQKYDTSNATFTVEAGNYYAGGLVGAAYDTHIEYCYSWSDAKATRYAGGFAGRFESADGAHLLKYCYAAGAKVEADSNNAGMVGYIDIRPGRPDNCYWNSTLGSGFIGLYDGGNNSSFTLTNTLAAMNNVLNTLNNPNEEWELTRTTYGGYVLPTLLKNKGKAQPKTGE